jgi:uncharacterized protein (DUF2384 family)|tara:strand:- start:352 stop:579 length:228 start_codon:yes stop_codon:yes gene_type:complete
MKQLLENWRKLLEGEVLNFPHQPKISEEDLQRVIALEGRIGELLREFYGNTSEIPIDVIDIMEALINATEESLKK